MNAILQNSSNPSPHLIGLANVTPKPVKAVIKSRPIFPFVLLTLTNFKIKMITKETKNRPRNILATSKCPLLDGFFDIFISFFTSFYRLKIVI
ncbi:hypothetical protein [Mycoplasma mycoides]|uniref:hypothetical protein n=1 Tax=Mycoplasma mycoides TaxID=2102 RepID=UPI001D113D6B|nr:hypothetical protein [Mycoplasma mycoides]